MARAPDDPEREGLSLHPCMEGLHCIPLVSPPEGREIGTAEGG